ncbi:uncharacterized protein LOC111359794 [Spodoptera litura]|uniref:Uncharacterized protein LOC111359794 n=1 Tax=Spodoptera litura TaxID=69820 RepID=A0A9J7EHQ3_SPOLT|nr:uncharacterized protein LOC111359794 [Spodoptera litura]
MTCSYVDNEPKAYYLGSLSLQRDISKNYNPTSWSVNGADTIEDVLRRLCPKLNMSKRIPVKDCKGVKIFDFELFYPHYYLELDEIFQPPSERFDLHRPYTYHMWNFLSHNMTIYKGTVYQILAKTFCPTIYDTYRHEFYADTVKVEEKVIKN